MLQLRKLDPPVREINKADYGLILDFGFEWKDSCATLYLFTANYLEIGLLGTYGAIGSIGLLGTPVIYRLTQQEPIILNEKIGRPLFRTQQLWPKAEDDRHVHKHCDRDMEMYITDSSVTIILVPRPIVLMVRNKQILFGFDENKELCLIKFTEQPPEEMARLEKDLSRYKSIIEITKNTLSYSLISYYSHKTLQLKNIAPMVNESITSNVDLPLRITFDNWETAPGNRMYWYIGQYIEIGFDKKMGTIGEIALLCTSTVYRTNKKTTPLPMSKKSGLPMFNARQWSESVFHIDENPTHTVDVYLENDAATIIIFPHYAVLTITNGRVTFGFNANKTLCSIAITDFDPQEMSKLVQSLRSRTSIIDASNQIINYALFTHEDENMLQRKGIGPSMNEQIEFDFYQLLNIKFCEQLAKPEDSINWRIDRFVEIKLNRTTGAIEQLTLCSHCNVGKLTRFKTLKLTALQWINNQKGLPTFKTLLWLEGIPKKDIILQEEYILLLDDHTITIEFSSHIITSTVTNHRVIFGFNRNQSLCSVTITDLTKDEMKLLIKSLGNKIKNL